MKIEEWIGKIMYRSIVWKRIVYYKVKRSHAAAAKRGSERYIWKIRMGHDKSRKL